MLGSKRAASLDGRSRSRSSDNQSRRPGSGDRERQSVRTARSSLVSDTVTRAPDFRGEKNKNIQELIAFLRSSGVDRPERFTTKTLQCPPSKLFLEICKILFDLILPDHQLAARYEEEIPYIFKSLGYPYTISRSSVLSIAPHNWPSLCYAFVWLTRVIEEMHEIDHQIPMFIKFAQHVTVNPGQKEKYEREMRASILDEHNVKVMESQKQLDIQSNKLEQLMAAVSVGDKKAQELQESATAIEKNLERLYEYKLAALQYLQPKTEMVMQLDATLQGLAALLSGVKVKREELDVEYNMRAQELTPQERDEMKEQQATYIRLSKQFSAELEELQKSIWESEINLTQAQKDNENWCRNLNIMLDKHMDASVADDLRVSPYQNRDKVRKIVQPYMEKTMDSLRRDMGLREQLDLRERLGARLKIEEMELDTLRQKLKTMQQRDESLLSRMSNKCQEAIKENEMLNRKMHEMSLEKDEAVTEEKQLKESVATSSMEFTELKAYHKLDEERRVEKVSAAFDEYEETAKQQEETLRKQKHEMEQLKVTWQCLHAQWISVNQLTDQLDMLENSTL